MMANNDIGDAEIREYLLGRTTPEAAERLDELSFTDEYAERIGSVEHDLIDEYLVGELSAAQSRAFEIHYLASPLRREKVQFARDLTNYAVSSRPAQTVEPDQAGSIWERFRNWRMTLQFGMAAAGLLLVALFGALVYRNSLRSGDTGPVVATDLGTRTPANAGTVVTPERTATPTPALAQNPLTPTTDRTNANQTGAAPKPKPTATPTQPKRQRPPSLAIFTLTPAVRSASFQSVKMPTGPAEFRLRLETESDGPFTAEIVELRGQARVWAARSVAASGRDDERTVSFRVPAGTIHPGEHRVTVFARGTGGQQQKVGDYFLRVAP